MAQSPTQTPGKKGVAAASMLPLIVLAMAQVGTSADSGAFSVAMADLMRTFGCSVADVQMAQTMCSLMSGTFMLVSGLAGIVLGWVRIFRTGLIMALVAELVCVFAPNIDLLIWCGRTLMGLGASLIIPAVLGMVSMLYEGQQRKQAYGVIAASAALATLVPIPLGMLVDSLGFRFTFGVMAAYFGLLLVASSVLPKSSDFGHVNFDAPGAILASIGLFCVMFGLSRVSSWGVIEPLPSAPGTLFGISPALPIAALGLIVLIALIPLERRQEQNRGTAILPRSFSGDPVVRGGLVAIALPFFYMGAQGLIATSYYQLVVGLGGTQTALLGIISGVPTLVLAMFIPRKYPHLNPWMVVRVGYVCMAVAALCMAQGVRELELSPVMVVGTLIGGIAVGLVNSQANNIVASSVPPRDAQQSGGIQGAARNLGLALGSAAMGSVLLVAVNSGLDARIAASTALEDAQRPALEEVVYTYEGDAAFAARMEAMGVKGDTAAALAAEHTAVRADAGALAMQVVAGVAGVALLSTFPRKKEAAAVAE